MTIARFEIFDCSLLHYLEDLLYDAAIEETSIAVLRDKDALILPFFQYITDLADRPRRRGLLRRQIAPRCRCVLAFGAVHSYRVHRHEENGPCQLTIGALKYDSTSGVFTIDTHERVTMEITVYAFEASIEITDERVGEKGEHEKHVRA